MDKSQYWHQIYHVEDEFSLLLKSYWRHYSNIGTWQFWVVVVLFIVPLIVLCLKVDRKRIFELFFFGYTIHLLWAYTDLVLARHGYLVHQYFLIPILPFALNLTASLLPISYLLLYQYCSNHNKNFYLYFLILSALFSFVFAPVEEYFKMLELRKGMHLIYIFCIDVVIVLIAYESTRIIKKLTHK